MSLKASVKDTPLETAIFIVASLSCISWWDFPKGYQCAVAYHHKPNELPEEFAEFQPLLDVVSVANSMCLMLGIGIGADSMQNYMFPEPLERLGVTNFEALMSDLVDFASKATEEMADMRGF